MKTHRKLVSLYLHAGVILGLFLAQFFLPDYLYLAVTRVMILSVFAIAYNILFGYTGLLSLGHAMFFSVGLYTAGLTVYHLEWSAAEAFVSSIGVGLIFSILLGAVALRTSGVAFMIVTLMFSQVFYLGTLYFTTYTRGDEGLVLSEGARQFTFLFASFDLSDPSVRYVVAWLLLSLSIIFCYVIARSRLGRALVAIRENETRTQMLGYNTFMLKLVAVIISGTLSSISGAAYVLLFAYAGSSFATIQYSIDALLYTLLGGAGTVLGPVLGAFLMFFMIDITSEYTSAYLLIAGIILVFLVMYFPRGILGEVRHRWLQWLP